MTDKMRNIGPKSMAWLRQTGVRTLADLHEVGSLAAYVRIKRAGFKPSLNLLYALEGALLDCHWQEIPAERRQELIIAADAAVSLLPKGRGKPMPAAGPVTTTIHDAGDGEDGGAPAMDLGFDDPDQGGGGED